MHWRGKWGTSSDGDGAEHATSYDNRVFLSRVVLLQALDLDVNLAVVLLVQQS